MERNTQLNQQALERVSATMRDAVRSYAAMLLELDAANVRSLTLFGEVLSDGFEPADGPAQSVLVLERMDLNLLRRLAERGVTLGKMGIAAPLVMTTLHIETSRDTFPIEFIEIQQRCATIFGESPFDGLSFEPVHVRLECERELKRFLIGLRQGLLVSVGRQAELNALQRDAARGLLRTLRGMLWLKGARTYQSDERVIAGVEEVVKKPLRGLRGALSRTTGGAGLDELYADVELLKVAVDGW